MLARARACVCVCARAPTLVTSMEHTTGKVGGERGVYGWADTWDRGERMDLCSLWRHSEINQTRTPSEIRLRLSTRIAGVVE